MGIWTWHVLLVRCYYSCFHASYKWIQAHLDDGLARPGSFQLWPAVIKELAVIVALAGSEIPVSQAIAAPAQRGKGRLEATLMEDTWHTEVNELGLTWTEWLSPTRGSRCDFWMEAAQQRLLTRVSQRPFFRVLIHVPLGTLARPAGPLESRVWTSSLP